jgi:hypothetical protein
LRASAIDLLKKTTRTSSRPTETFEKMDQEDLPAMQALVREVCTALEVHARVEEEIFYPPARLSTTPQRP